MTVTSLVSVSVIQTLLDPSVTAVLQDTTDTQNVFHAIATRMVHMEGPAMMQDSATVGQHLKESSVTAVDQTITTIPCVKSVLAIRMEL